MIPSLICCPRGRRAEDTHQLHHQDVSGLRVGTPPGEKLSSLATQLCFPASSSNCCSGALLVEGHQLNDPQILQASGSALSVQNQQLLFNQSSTIPKLFQSKNWCELFQGAFFKEPLSQHKWGMPPTGFPRQKLQSVVPVGE